MFQYFCSANAPLPFIDCRYDTSRGHRVQRQSEKIEQSEESMFAPSLPNLYFQDIHAHPLTQSLIRKHGKNNQVSFEKQPAVL